MDKITLGLSVYNAADGSLMGYEEHLDLLWHYYDFLTTFLTTSAL